MIRILFFIAILLTSQISFSQIGINQYNDKGQKEGYWLEADTGKSALFVQKGEYINGLKTGKWIYTRRQFTPDSITCPEYSILVKEEIYNKEKDSTTVIVIHDGFVHNELDTNYIYSVNFDSTRIRGQVFFEKKDDEINKMKFLCKSKRMEFHCVLMDAKGNNIEEFNFKDLNYIVDRVQLGIY